MKAWPLLSLLLVGVVVSTAGAETPGRPVHEIPVQNRSLSEFAPIGARFGSVMLYPSARLIENFDSNIYATPTTEKSDWITEIAPQFRLETLNRKRGAKAKIGSHHGFYKSRSSENYNDFDAALRPFWEITHALKAVGDFSWMQNHERRSDPDAVQNRITSEPVRYQQTIGRLELNYKPGRMGANVFAERRYLDYRNTQSIIPGEMITNNDRNRYENLIGAELSCDISDARSNVYWRSEWFNRDYRRGDFDQILGSYASYDRDSVGLRSVLGVRFPLTHTISANVNAGYRNQNFDASAYKDVGTGVASAMLTWQITGLTTLDFNAYRDVYETNQDAASAFVQTQAGINVAHELRRPFILQAGFGVGNNDYIGLNRNDDYWNAHAGFIYKMNRFLHWRMEYSYEDRSSDVDAVEYDKHRVFLTALVQF